MLINYPHRTLFRSWQWILSTASPALRWGVIVQGQSGGIPREEVLPTPHLDGVVFREPNSGGWLSMQSLSSQVEWALLAPFPHCDFRAWKMLKVLALRGSRVFTLLLFTAHLNVFVGREGNRSHCGHF